MRYNQKPRSSALRKATGKVFYLQKTKFWRFILELKFGRISEKK